MKIEKIDYNQLKITLSCTEMLQMNLEIDPSESRNILTKLLYSLESDYQFSLMNQKIMLEMIPSEQDGCNIFITKAESEQLKISQSENLLIFSFEQWDAIEYVRTQIETEFLIYCLDGLYYLILYPHLPEQTEQLKLLLSDFGECVSNPVLFESVLKEYGNPLSYMDSLPKTIK